MDQVGWRERLYDKFKVNLSDAELDDYDTKIYSKYVYRIMVLVFGICFMSIPLLIVLLKGLSIFLSPYLYFIIMDVVLILILIPYTKKYHKAQKEFVEQTYTFKVKFAN